MKSNLAKIFAVILVFSLVFSFAACTGGKDDKTTAAVNTSDSSTTSDSSVTEGTNAATDSSTAPTLENTTGTTVPGETTTKPTGGKTVTIKAPVNGTIAQIVAFYNQYANATKAYKGKVTVSGRQGTTTTIKSVTGGSIVKDLAQKMVPNDFKTITTKTFKNGVQVGGTSTLKKALPCDDSDKMSTLEPAGVKSATCVQNGNTWKVVITLKEEVCNNLNDVPRYHAQCMDTVSISANDLKPFTLVSAKVIYTDKTTITAIVNQKGLLDYVGIYEPDDLTGTLKYGFVKVNAVLTGTWQQYLNFSY